MQRLSTGVVALVAVCVLVVVGGCGSSGPASRAQEPGVGTPQGTGSLRIAIKFPARDVVGPQDLPYATNSVHITVESQGGIVVEECLARPAPNGGTATPHRLSLL